MPSGGPAAVAGPLVVGSGGGYVSDLFQLTGDGLDRLGGCAYDVLPQLDGLGVSSMASQPSQSSEDHDQYEDVEHHQLNDVLTVVGGVDVRQAVDRDHPHGERDQQYSRCDDHQNAPDNSGVGIFFLLEAGNVLQVALNGSCNQKHRQSCVDQHDADQRCENELSEEHAFKIHVHFLSGSSLPARTTCRNRGMAYILL